MLAVECRAYGGTISTVRHAVEQNRDVFAIPGANDAPISEGTNRLIREGARLVTCGRDILEEYWQRYPLKLTGSVPLTPEAAQARLDDLRREDERRSEDEKPRTKKIRPEPGPEEEPVQKDGRERIGPGEQKERFTDDELALLHALGGGNMTADELVERTQLPARRILSALTMLQIAASVEELPGKRFRAMVILEESDG